MKSPEDKLRTALRLHVATKRAGASVSAAHLWKEACSAGHGCPMVDTPEGPRTLGVVQCLYHQQQCVDELERLFSDDSLTPDERASRDEFEAISQEVYESLIDPAVVYKGGPRRMEYQIKWLERLSYRNMSTSTGIERVHQIPGRNHCNELC